MSALVERAVGWRHGIVAHAGEVPTAMADLPVRNWGASTSPAWRGASAGGVAFDGDAAMTAAVAEAVERYAASVCPLPTVEPGPGDEVVGIDAFTLHDAAQRRRPGFPYAEAYRPRPALTTAWCVADGRPVLVPVSLVTLDPHRSVIATSSGLAADGSPLRALLRAVQELVERDALMTAWLHGVAPARVPLPEELARPVAERAGEATCFDLTPAWSPHPVAAVAGNAPLRGRPRLSLGVACRATWDAAVAKAWLEWAQGTVFAGTERFHPGDLRGPADVTDFDRHAVYYTLHPGQWAGLPIWRGPAAGPPPDAPVVGGPGEELHALADALGAAGIDVYAREVTTVDAARAGLRVVRALAPALAPVHGDHNWPFVGGTAPDLQWRYPGATAGCRFPNPAPHPLG